MAGEPIFIWDDEVELLNASALTASSTKSGFPTANVQDRREFTPWSSSGAGGQWFRVDMGAPVQIKAMGIAGHNFGSLVIPNITLTADNVAAGHPLANVIVAAFSPSNDRAIAKTFDSTFRYWELTLPAGASNEPAMGVFFLAGDYLTWENIPDSPIDPDAQVIDATDMIGGSGHLLGTVLNWKMRSFPMVFNALSQSWVENTFWPFYNINGRKSFFAVWEPTLHPDEVSFMRIKDKRVTAPYQDIWRSITLNLEGLFDAQ